MEKYRVVIDTNVIVTALLSNKGASFKLMEIIEKNDNIDVSISVPLFFEYEYALSKKGFSNEEIDDYLGWLCANSINWSYKMNVLQIPINENLYSKIKELSEKENISIESFASLAIEEKIE